MLTMSPFETGDDAGTSRYDEAIDEKPVTDTLCVVCGDFATGRHYGAIACNGCKGFFRRTIRRNYKYTCRFTSSCNIDKHNRAVCRFCRYTRCINAGMKVEAVQNERDVIGKRMRTTSVGGSTTSTGRVPVVAAKRHSLDEPAPAKNISHEFSDTGTRDWDNPKYLLESLLSSESTIRSLRETVIKQTGSAQYTTKPENPPPPPPGGERTANMNDIFLSLHSQLLLVIEWAKTLPPFAALSTDDQTALLKHFAAQHVVLCVAYRSIDTNDFLKLINDSCIPRNKTKSNDFYIRDCERVMDQVVAPMRFLKIDDVEFVAMKACVLFNPVTKGLSNEAIPHVLASRRKIFAALEGYMRKKNPEDRSRVGDITFFVLSPLQSIANTLSEDIMVTKLSGICRIDQLMEELILSDTDEHKCTESRTQHVPIREMSDSRPGSSPAQVTPPPPPPPPPNPFARNMPVLAEIPPPIPTTRPQPMMNAPLNDDFENFAVFTPTAISSFPVNNTHCDPADSLSSSLGSLPPWNTSPISSCDNGLFLPTCTDYR